MTESVPNYSVQEDAPDKSSVSREGTVTAETFNSNERDVDGLTSNIEFYQLLNKRIHVKEDAASKARYDFYCKWILPLRYVALIIYIVVLPFV